MTTTTTPGNRKKAGMGMSEALAETIFTWANVFFIASLVVGVVAAFLIYISANVKESYWKRDREAARERIGELDARAAEARRELGYSQERIAELGKETAEAKLEQERLKAQLAWRTLTFEMANKIHAKLATKPGFVRVQFVKGDPESHHLAIEFANLFIKAKWTAGVTSLDIPGATLAGMYVPGPDTPEVILIREALTAAGIGFSVGEIPAPAMATEAGPKGVTIPADAPRLVVGSKPQPPITNK
ncbi:MAG TPA: hypothetical protein VH933_11490 [Aestuariivirgaceae bacterium]|jgi:hypothetical protein